MDHIAIMKKSWGLIPKIISWDKTVESRWYKNKSVPWDKIKLGDSIYFKDSGEPVTVKANVTKVLQFEDLDEGKRKQILDKYGSSDLGTGEIMPEVQMYVENKKYCILVFFDKVKKIQPFNIDKTGFGMMAAWICVDNIDSVISL